MLVGVVVGSDVTDGVTLGVGVGRLLQIPHSFVLFSHKEVVPLHEQSADAGVAVGVFVGVLVGVSVGGTGVAVGVLVVVGVGVGTTKDSVLQLNIDEAPPK